MSVSIWRFFLFCKRSFKTEGNHHAKEETDSGHESDHSHSYRFRGSSGHSPYLPLETDAGRIQQNPAVHWESDEANIKGDNQKRGFNIMGKQKPTKEVAYEKVR